MKKKLIYTKPAFRIKKITFNLLFMDNLYLLDNSLLADCGSEGCYQFSGCPAGCAGAPCYCLGSNCAC